MDSYGDWVSNGISNQAGGMAKMTKTLYPYDSLFSPVTVNRTTIKNHSDGSYGQYNDGGRNRQTKRKNAAIFF